MEQLAIFVNGRVFGGRKSGIEGIDLEFEREGVLYLVNIKSGPNRGNSSQVGQMKEQFRKAKQRFRTSGGSLHVECVNGCCYGKGVRDKGDYRKLCGQAFWEFISGMENLYIDLIVPLGHNARKWNDAYETKYEAVLSRMIADFRAKFCLPNGSIDWEKIVRYNSGK